MKKSPDWRKLLQRTDMLMRHSLFPTNLRFLRWIPVLTAVAMLDSGKGFAQAPAPASGTTAAPAPSEVKVAKVTAATAPLDVALPARTAPAEESHIYSRATGIVRARPVDIGDQVKKGDILAEIDAPEVGFQLEGAKASLMQAEARLSLARNELARARTLAPTRAIALEDIESRESTLREAEAEAAIAKAEISRLESVREFQTIRAPFPGIIAKRQVDRGDHVRGDQSSEEQWLYHLVRLDELRVEVDATAELALKVNLGEKAELTFPDLPGKTITAEVRRRTGVIDAASGTMRLELVLPNPDLALPAGLSGNARFSLPARPGTTLIPVNTLLNREGRAFVLRAVDGKVTATPIVPGRNLGPVLEVLSGLTPGDLVITSPNSLLREGDPVVVKESAPQGK